MLGEIVFVKNYFIYNHLLSIPLVKHFRNLKLFTLFKNIYKKKKMIPIRSLTYR